MARMIGPVCKLCRREGAKLYLKGERCYTERCSFDRRPYPPGQHGKGRIKVSEYGKRLREKQKVRRIYGVLERQFRRTFDTAAAAKGVTGERLLQLLESRMDSVVFRMGLAVTRADARQLVRHGHVRVNGRRVDIPSFIVKPGSTVSLVPGDAEKERVKKAIEVARSRDRAPWLELAADGTSAVFKAPPDRRDLEAIQPIEIDEHLIVEFYSR
ncbi:MAG: 30S ribosomal protein S4 [Deltaproteobacteria bacterium]|nr:30S ribosomal protein S4 [Deltaproteobacteria bacterium]